MHSKIRDGLHARLGIADGPKWDDTSAMMAEVKSKWGVLDRIVALAKDRLVMGAIRYGRMADYTWPDIRRKMQTKLDTYDKTGNSEMLVDLVNYCALEFGAGTHPDHHFDALDDEAH
jgi:hypothetical protein